MKYIQLRDATIPALGFGTWKLDGKRCQEAVGRALDLGYRHIDTAQMYENESAVGRAIQESGVPRSEVWLTTKVGLGKLEPKEVESAVAESLERLQTDYVDLLLIHWPDPAVPLEKTLAAFEGLRERGQVRHTGVSNFPPSLLRKAIEIAPVICDQVEYHPFLDQSDLLRLAGELDIMITAYSPLAQGEVVQNETLKQIGEKHGKSPAQIALRWLIDHDRVSVIPKAGSPEHIRSNFDIFDFELEAEDREAIDGLARGHRLIDPSWAPDWSK